MHSIEWDELGLEDVVRVLRALGGHRYVAATDVRVHAFLLAVADVPELETHVAWARAVLADDTIDAMSRAPELWRSVTHKELAFALEAVWLREGASERRTKLRAIFDAADMALDETRELFDERLEGTLHPVLIDAGWELLRLAELDAERHRGVMDAFGDALSFESARFEEQSSIPAPAAYALEVPAFGAEEVLFMPDRVPSPFVVWVEGPEPYLDYLLRGVAKVAKVPEPFEEAE